MTLLEYFISAAKEIVVDFELNPKKIKIRHVQTPRIGLDYTAELYVKGRGFDFHLRTVTEDEDPTQGEMTASLTISFKEEAAPYFFHENIDYVKEHSHFLSRWASWAIFNFRQEHQKVDLQSLFHDTILRVYGLPLYSTPAEQEAELLFRGIIAAQKSKLFIYKFRHVRRADLYRSFSYAVRVDLESGLPFWVFFPETCGLDSGGARHTYEQFENLISLAGSKLEVEIKRVDIEYSELEKFLLGNAESFESIIRTDRLEDLFRFSHPSMVLEGSEEQYERLLQRLDAEEYPQVLRDLRALVQQAEENVAKKKNIDISEIAAPDVNKLAALLIKEKLLDGRLYPWFQAFATIANIASHRDFPTQEELEDWTLRRRIFLTIYLGRQLLEELEDIIRPPRINLFRKVRLTKTRLPKRQQRGLKSRRTQDPFL